MGSKYKNKYLGAYGDFSTFSFYYSHQITAGEGGMIACKKKEDYNLLKILRAHGWDRDVKSNKNKKFNFINSGFNVRPLEISAAIGLNQFKRLFKMMSIRAHNRYKIIQTLKNSKKWQNQFTFFNHNKNLKPSWFGLPLLINIRFKDKKEKFLKYLNKNNIETRPIISGNFINQPAINLYDIRYDKKELNNSNEIDQRGFFIGLPTVKLTPKQLNKIGDLLLNI